MLAARHRTDQCAGKNLPPAGNKTDRRPGAGCETIDPSPARASLMDQDMSNSSIRGGTSAPQQPAGSDVDRLGPSDRSDSGSDIQGEQPMATEPDNPAEWGAIPAHADSSSDTWGTGERSSAAGQKQRDGGDIMPDRIVGGIGAGPDREAEDVQAAVDSLADDDQEDIQADHNAGRRDERDQVETTPDSRPQRAGRLR